MKKLVFVLTLTLLCGVVNTNAGSLWVTENFNQKRLLEKEVFFEDKSVAEVLGENARVKTAFAGNFITSIEGVEVAEGRSWFYYVNGILAEVGAGEFHPGKDDIVWWDFHLWREGRFINSVIGAYPEPFLSGYSRQPKKTIIVYTSFFEQEAVELRDYFKKLGVEEIETKLCDKEIFKEDAMFIIIGSWQDLKQYKFAANIFENYKKPNLFVKFSDDKLLIMDTEGRPREEYENASVITSVRIGFDKSAKAVWFVTGANNGAVKIALDELINNPRKIKFYSSAVFVEGEILNVPVFSAR